MGASAVNDPKVIAKLLRAIAGGTETGSGHAIIFNAAALLLDPPAEEKRVEHPERVLMETIMITETAAVTIEDMIEWTEQECRGSPIATELLAFLKRVQAMPDTDTPPMRPSTPEPVVASSLPWTQKKLPWE